MTNRGRPRSGEGAFRAFGRFAVLGTLGVLLLHPLTRAAAQNPPPPTAAASPSPSPAVPAASPSAASSSSPAPGFSLPAGLSPAGASPEQSPAPGESPAWTVPLPVPTPTQPPIVVDPPSASVALGGSQSLRLTQVMGLVSASVADPKIVAASVDQGTRTLVLAGKGLGSTVVTVQDERGMTRDVPVRVAYAAGTIAPQASIRVTGNPATQYFIKELAAQAAIKAAVARPGATVFALPDDVPVENTLPPDDVTTAAVPVTIQGTDYVNVTGTTLVRVENFAQPNIRPRSLLVSDFPETLKENGILFTADLTAQAAERFLYYHYNPPGQPDRRVVLKVQNSSAQPALVQFISGMAGPGPYEMEVGHLSTQRFLVRLTQNEGSVVQIPGGATITLVDQPLPARMVVSNLLQLREIDGGPLHLTLVAQDANDPIDGAVPDAQLLVGDKPHARGIYPIPEFYFDYNYDAQAPELEIPIGQIPLPNLVEGQTLSGDYGVLQSITIRIINNDRHNARQIALYANPRGGGATGTFIIDRVLVQAHKMQPFGHYKLRQYTIPPGSYVRTEVVTMPEGGSSYPLRLVVAPDDGSPPPGAPDSIAY
ncbi:MAG: pilus assembly protein N-terminal domain-containing protein [Candidatus Baltobacteraceae bacterium]|jgi:hypothetical protein